MAPAMPRCRPASQRTGCAVFWLMRPNSADPTAQAHQKRQQDQRERAADEPINTARRASTAPATSSPPSRPTPGERHQRHLSRAGRDHHRLGQGARHRGVGPRRRPSPATRRWPSSARPPCPRTGAAAVRSDQDDGGQSQAERGGGDVGPSDAQIGQEDEPGQKSPATVPNRFTAYSVPMRRPMRRSSHGRCTKCRARMRQGRAHQRRGRRSTVPPTR